ncbi:MAG: Panacea domain-containing protein [Pseudomonadota bacterium]
MKTNQNGKHHLVGFQSRKAAQVSAFFAQGAGPSIDKLKLIKLIYLAERQFMLKYGQPMLYDEFFSLRHGPICSNALNGINGDIDRGTWSAFISKQQNKISATRTFSREDFDEISNAEIEVLKSTLESFGFMTASQLRNYTHKHCPEYTEIESGRIPINYFSLFKVLGLQGAEYLAGEIDQYRKTEAMLSSK